jgi:hypothetical protein
LNNGVAAANAQVANLQTALAAVQANPALALGPYVKVETAMINGLKGPHVIFDGANVHVRSGFGSTNEGYDGNPAWHPTGLGNLIIGYNEPPEAGDAATLRAGSHCLVLGTHNSYVSCVGIVTGDSNNLTGLCASVLGGSYNSASSGGAILGGWSNTTTITTFGHQCISGGALNTVTGWAGSVSGGGSGTAGLLGSIGGGWANTALDYGTVCGGENNTAGNMGVVSGGDNNSASGRDASVSGGSNNVASGGSTSVSGGMNRQAASNYSWAAGSLYQDN